jgi:hypothetical protein
MSQIFVIVDNGGISLYFPGDVIASSKERRNTKGGCNETTHASVVPRCFKRFPSSEVQSLLRLLDSDDDIIELIGKGIDINRVANSGVYSPTTSTIFSDRLESSGSYPSRLSLV